MIGVLLDPAGLLGMEGTGLEPDDPVLPEFEGTGELDTTTDEEPAGEEFPGEEFPGEKFTGEELTGEGPAGIGKGGP